MERLSPCCRLGTLTETRLFRPHRSSCKNRMNSMLWMGKLRPKRGSGCPGHTESRSGMI